MRLGYLDSDDHNVKDRIESKRHKIKNRNQNPSQFPDNVVPFPRIPLPNPLKISGLYEDLFCSPEAEEEG
ncbi:hypothetical protein LPTSP4_17180 [Leptospira ryugenii]|uniref:Uncharacterized protein n=1 Tax=Leptospira ryugenii TaxID=1917863 RepID=A0A2P2DZX9_9LEPT|nr:hypothetical protein LPTSP4_17180 [Leptospira ryugenii]